MQVKTPVDFELESKFLVKFIKDVTHFANTSTPANLFVCIIMGDLLFLYQITITFRLADGKSPLFLLSAENLGLLL